MSNVERMLSDPICIADKDVKLVIWKTTESQKNKSPPYDLAIPLLGLQGKQNYTSEKCSPRQCLSVVDGIFLSLCKEENATISDDVNKLGGYSAM